MSRSLPLTSYLFLVIASYTIGKSARSALFLGEFDAVKLPYTYFAIAVLAGLVAVGYSRLGRRTSLRNLLVGSLLLFAGNAAVFWWLAHYYAAPWLYPVIYVWVGIFGVLAPAQVWTLANYVLTTREAKRMFGVVSSGGILGWIFGGLVAKTIGVYGAEYLVLAVGLLLAACAAVVSHLCRPRPNNAMLDRASAAEAIQTDDPQTFLNSIRLVWSSPYISAIAAVICLSSGVTTVAGWQFQAIAQQALVEKNALAVFFGRFDFYCGLICLAAQLLLTSRVLRRFGIGVALFVVPLGLMFGSIAILAWGTLAAAVLLKGSDQTLRYSIDRSTVELLYLPVPANVKLQVKSFVDTAIWRFGDGLAGVLLLIVATYWQWTAQQIAWLNLAVIAGWMGAAVVAGRQYVTMLRTSILEHRLDAERSSAPVLDRSTANILASSIGLNAVDSKEILYALGLFEMEQHPASHPAIRLLLQHPSPEVRRKAIAILGAAGDKSVQAQIEGLLKDPHSEVRREALLYLAHHTTVDPLERIQDLSDFGDASLPSALVSFLARPGSSQNLETAALILECMVRDVGPNRREVRLESARLVAKLPDHFDDQLSLLLDDEDKDVVKEALRSAGSLRKTSFVPQILARLADPDLRASAADALVACGDPIIPQLDDHLCESDLPLEARREIPSVLVSIGTAAAMEALSRNMLQTDTTLRFRVISALNKLRLLHPEPGVDAGMVETVLLAEIMGHYRSYQILGALDAGTDDPVVSGVRESMNQEVERIFRLLGLLFPNHDFHSAYVGLQAADLVVHDNALEFLDSVLKPKLRNVLVPLLDSDVSVAERIERANRLLGAKVETRQDAAAILIFSDDAWLKSCGAFAIGAFGLHDLGNELDACLNHPDPLLRETARQAKLRLNGQGAASGS